MELTFEDFINRAKDDSLSPWEKIGFPDSYRKGKDAIIFADIFSKLDLGNSGLKRILDIGCGCSELVNYFIEFSVKERKELTLVDSDEMIKNIKSDYFPNELVISRPGKFPDLDIPDGHYDAISVYSVIQYPFLHQSVFQFIHASLYPFAFASL